MILSKRIKHPIRKIRLFSKLTKQELANRMEMSLAEIIEIEACTSNKIKMSLLLRVIDACGLKVVFTPVSNNV